MTIAEQLQQNAQKTKLCKLGAHLAMIDEDDAQAVEKLLPDIPVDVALKTLRDNDIDIGEKTLQRHKHQTCMCVR